MALEAAESWRKCFTQWPPDVDRKGVLVTTFQEQIPFESFAASEDMLLIERRAPDTLGGRMVILSYHNIEALKIVDVVKMKVFQSLGFAIPPSRK
jgi:hypothetical protein